MFSVFAAAALSSIPVQASATVAPPLATMNGTETFGADGLAFHQYPEHGEARAAIVDLAAASRGEVVAALGNERANPRRTYFGAARFDANGSLDPSFGRGGFARLMRPPLGRELGLVNGQAEALAVDRRGRIVLAGFRYRDASSQVRYPVLARLLPDGTPDMTFGRAGIVTPRRVPGYGEWFSDVAIARGGRIVAVGGRTQLHERVGSDGRRPATLVRGFLPDGRVDRGFARNGSLVTPVPSRSDLGLFTAFRTIKVVQGGRLLLSGYRSYRLLVERLRPNGQPDRSFGRDGSVEVGFEGSECFYLCEYESALTLTRDNRIVVQGFLNPLGSERAALVRLLPSGRIDRSFGSRGVAYDQFADLVQIGAIVPSPGDHFVVIGSGRGRSGSRYSLLALRFRPSGRLDPGFGDRGILALGPRRGNGGGMAALSRPGGGLIAAGGAWLVDDPPGPARGSQVLMLAHIPPEQGSPQPTP